MQKSRDYSHLYSRLIDGELSIDERQILEKHLEENAQEKQRVEQLKSLRNAMQNLQPVKISDDFSTILRARIQMEKKVGRLSLVSVLQAWRVPAFGVATAVAIFIVFSFLQPSRNQIFSSDSQPVPAIELGGAMQRIPAANIHYSLDHFDAPPASGRRTGMQKTPNIETAEKMHTAKFATTDSLTKPENPAVKLNTAQVQFTY